MNISLGRKATGATQHINGGSRNGLQRLLGNTATHRAARSVHDLLDRETDRLTFWRSLQLVVERARRHNTEFTVLCIVHRAASQAAATAAQIAPHLRTTDAITAESARVLILLSDTVGSAAKVAVDRLSDHAGPESLDAKWWDVVFPRDALTFHGLVECLQGPEPAGHMLLAG